MCLETFMPYAHVFDAKHRLAFERRAYNPTRTESILQNAAQELERGHSIMDSLREHLEQTDKDSFRMEHQLVAHSKMLACCAATAYGELYYTKEKEIREYNGFDIIEKGVLIQAPRRNGKTETIVRFVAASLLCIPSFTVLVIAASKGAADNKTGILFLLKSFLTRIFGVTDFEYCNENTLQFRVAGNLRKVVSLSAEVGNRCVLFARCP